MRAGCGHGRGVRSEGDAAGVIAVRLEHTTAICAHCYAVSVVGAQRSYKAALLA